MSLLRVALALALTAALAGGCVSEHDCGTSGTIDAECARRALLGLRVPEVSGYALTSVKATSPDRGQQPIVTLYYAPNERRDGLLVVVTAQVFDPSAPLSLRRPRSSKVSP